ncbi:hypothetical protein HYV71_04610 [Candidatus Uhrbacteria bacterium]|nr:hypothetical protein [Candidatus Uhrbacteria bacterium]
MKDNRIELTAAAVIVAIIWFATANLAQSSRDSRTDSASFQFELNTTVMPINPKAVPSHQSPEPTPIPQPVDEELAKTVARK